MHTIDERVLVEILTSSEGSARLGLFLGAGCSVGAGVPLASAITQRATALLFEMYEHRQASSESEVEAWLAEKDLLQYPATRYSDVLELIRPTLRLRRQFLEQHFLDRQPSPAHWALANVVKAGLIRALFTTNFDDLIERAANQLTTLRVVTHEEQSSGVDDATHATLYKIHGDYLFDRLANTKAELTKLGAAHAEKLRLVCRSGGLVVVGYSGNDESVMSVLEAAAKDEMPLGFYWLVRDSEAPGRRVVDLVESAPNGHICRIAGFDDFAARLNGAAIRRQTTRRVERTIAGGGQPFVAHSDGVSKVVDAIVDAVRDRSSSVVCVSGMAGVGKTEAARHAVSKIRPDFVGTVLISGKNRVVTSNDILDECFLQLSIPGRGTDTNAAEAVVARLASAPILIFLDNADDVDGSVWDFLDSLPSSSRVIVTIRDAGTMRERIGLLWEVEHLGLNEREVNDLIDQWSRRSPSLRRKLATASPESIRRILHISSGLPEAILVIMATLSNTAISVNEIEQAVKSRLYGVILGSLYDRLSAPQKKCLNATVHFSSSVTPSGLSAVTGAKRDAVIEALGALVNMHLLRELATDQYTWGHPVVREFLVDKVRRGGRYQRRGQAADEFLREWTVTFGGQPRADWSNFASLDMEYDNIRSLMERTLERSDTRSVTAMYQSLFSYIVERGYWSATEAWCERMLNSDLAEADRADWLVWWSWIKFYLRSDLTESARLAVIAASIPQATDRQRFEAHRRALVAFGALGDEEAVRMHADRAGEIAGKVFAQDSNEAIDLLNARAGADLAIGSMRGEVGMIESALSTYLDAERINRGRKDPNSREIGVSILGRARCLSGLGGRDKGAMDLAQEALALSWKVSWLRGIEESNLLIAVLAARLGLLDIAQSARDVADRMGNQLRAAPA